MKVVSTINDLNILSTTILGTRWGCTMKKQLVIALVSLLLVTSVTSCGKTSEGHTFTSNSATNENEPTKTNNTNVISTDDNNTATTSDFEEGVFIDVDQLDSPHIDDNFKEVLQTMLEAVVKHDNDYFKNVYPDEASATQFENQLTEPNKFRFYEMEQDVYIDADERVSIYVDGQFKTEQNVKDFSWILYFKKDSQGIWKLIAID